jgi:hypothetical protein
MLGGRCRLDLLGSTVMSLGTLLLEVASDDGAFREVVVSCEVLMVLPACAETRRASLGVHWP